MSRIQLEAILAEFGLKIDGFHGGAGNFRDLEIGIGKDLQLLTSAQAKLRKENIGCAVEITKVSNRHHSDYGKNYLLVASYWWES